MPCDQWSYFRLIRPSNLTWRTVLTRTRPLLCVLFCALLLSATSSARASVSTFTAPFDTDSPQVSIASSDDNPFQMWSTPFDGTPPPVWTALPGSLPDESLAPFRPNTVAYAGGQRVTITRIDGVNAARLSADDAPSWTRFGYLSLATLQGDVGEIEVRINTLDQGGEFIDGLFDLWLVNSFDHSRFVRAGLFGDRSDSLRSWTYSSSLSLYSTVSPEDNQYLPPFEYRSNTWYRVRISQFPGRPLEVSIWNDAGDTRLASHRFPHTLADLGSSFRVGISQWNGGTNRTHSQQCAIASIHAWLAQ